jgi:hypothetical protein
MFWKSIKAKEASMTCLQCNAPRIEIDRSVSSAVSFAICDLAKQS